MKLKIYNLIYIFLFIISAALILYLAINLQFAEHSEGEGILFTSIGLAVIVILHIIEAYLYIRGFNKEASLLPIICFKEGAAFRINYISFSLFIIVGLAGLTFSIIFGLQILNVFNIIDVFLSDNYFFFSIALTLLINCSAALTYQIIWQKEKI